MYAQPIHWRRFFENPETVQFDHRSLGYLTFLSSYLLYFKNKDKPFPPSIKVNLRLAHPSVGCRMRFRGLTADGVVFYSGILGCNVLALRFALQAALRFVPIMTSLQLLLGIFTLLYYVPTELGVLHQVRAATGAAVAAQLACCHALVAAASLYPSPS